MVADEQTPIFQGDEQKGLPVWIQLRNRLVYLIRTGYFEPGEKLPSVRSLAADSAVNYNTVSKTYVNLEREGYVKSIHGRGVFVANNIPEESEEVEVVFVATTVLRDAAKRCMALGMPADEVHNLFCEIMDGIQKTK